MKKVPRRTRKYSRWVQIKLRVPGDIAQEIDRRAEQEARPTRANMVFALIKSGLAQKEASL